MNTAWRFHTMGWVRRGWRLGAGLIALLVFSSVALAASPVTGTFVGASAARGQQVTFTTPRNTVVTDWAGVLLLQLDGATPGDKQGALVDVFCIQLFVSVRPNDIYVSGGPVTGVTGGGYIRYLLARYPAASVTTQAEGAARQLAIWHFSDALDLTTIQDPAIRARAIALADEAQANGPLNTITPGVASLTLTPANATVPQGQPVAYTVTIQPPDAASSINITVDGTAVLDNGSQQATLPLNQGSATFNVTNPGVGTANITAIAPDLIDAGTVFDPRNNRRTQRLVLGNSLTLEARAQVQTTWQQATPTFTATPTLPGPTVTPTTPVDTVTPTLPSATVTPITATPGDAPTPPASVTPPATVPPTETTRPNRNNTPTPENPTAPPPGGQSTPTPENPTAPPPGGQSTPTPEGATAPPAGETPPAGGVPPATSSQAQPRPRSLPNTGSPAGDLAEWMLLAAVVLLVAGLALQKRGVRR
ncbi:MAG: hypothetical protein IPP13_01885 [Kouleothrix sp.]|jgi:hypothetical protein|nr:hypothetical protein [Kouleothrix sp.]